MAMASVSSRRQSTSSSLSYSSPFASSSAATFSSPASPLTARSCDLNLRRSSPPSPPSPSSSVRFSMEKRRSMTVTKQSNSNGAVSSNQKRTCMCSPTSHAGSFRCAYHKRLAEQKQKQKEKEQHQTASVQSSSPLPSSSSSNKLNLRRSAMKNTLVRIGVEGELVKRALTNLIRPSSHNQRRRDAFQPRPSRLSQMSKAQDS